MPNISRQKELALHSSSGRSTASATMLASRLLSSHGAMPVVTGAMSENSDLPDWLLS